MEADAQRALKAAWLPHLKHNVSVVQNPRTRAQVAKAFTRIFEKVLADGIYPAQFTRAYADAFVEDQKLQGVHHVQLYSVQKLAANLVVQIQEPSMPRKQPPEPVEVVGEEEESLEAAPDNESEEEEELPPEMPRARQVLQQPPQVVYVQAPTQRNLGGRPPGSQNKQPPQTRVGKLIPRNEKVRVFKRQAGRRVYVDDFTIEDIGGSMHKFLKELVNQNPEIADPAGTTHFEVSEVDPRTDGEKGAPASITIESQPMGADNGPLSQARSALDLIRELRGLEDEQLSGTRQVLDEAKKKAAGNSDFNGLMMLMMMERLQGGAPREDIAMKVLDQLKRSGGFGSGGNTFANEFPMPPPVQPQFIPMPPPPPPPAPDTALKDIAVQLINAQLAPKPQKDFAEQMKELVQLQAILNPPREKDPEMVALLKLLAERTAAPATGNGIDGALATFDKLTSVVKMLAPQVNMGGIAGALQSILTPQLGSAIGNMLAGSLGAIGKGAAQQPTPPPLPGLQQPALPAKTPPAEMLPTEVIQKVDAVRAATTLEAARLAVIDLLQSMYSVPRFAAQLDPALKALMAGDVKPARGVLNEVLEGVRKELVNPRFIDDTIAAMITQVGGVPPPELMAVPPQAPLAVPEVPLVPDVVVTVPASAPVVIPAVELVPEPQAPEPQVAQAPKNGAVHTELPVEVPPSITAAAVPVPEQPVGKPS